MLIITGGTILFGFIAWAVLSAIVDTLSGFVDKIEEHFESK